MADPEEVAEVETLVAELISIVKDAEAMRVVDRALGQKPRDIFEGEARERAREIGARLNEIDGMNVMRYVHAKVSKAWPTATAALEYVWRGIGDWR